MPYIPPSYDDLHRTTIELQLTYNKESNRYDPPSYEILTEKVSKMEANYRQRVKEKPNLFFAKSPDLVRFEEIARIVHMVDDFPETLPNSFERKQVHDILLGALFYRRLSIEASYKVNSPKSSALYLTIEEILLLEPEKNNTLDALTVNICCDAYQTHLQGLDARKASLYIRKQEDHFVPELERFISEADGASRSMREQMEHLVAIQSIGKLVSIMNREVGMGLNLFTNALVNELKMKTSLSKDGMMRCLKAVKLSPMVRAMIEYLVPDAINLNNDSCGCFLDDMLANLAVFSQQVLLGVYVVLLKEIQADNIHLRKTLHVAINADTLGNALDDDARIRALTALGEYLDLPSVCDLDFTAWRSHNSLKQNVEKEYRSLREISELSTVLVL